MVGVLRGHSYVVPIVIVDHHYHHLRRVAHSIYHFTTIYIPLSLSQSDVNGRYSICVRAFFKTNMECGLVRYRQLWWWWSLCYIYIYLFHDLHYFIVIYFILWNIPNIQLGQPHVMGTILSEQNEKKQTPDRQKRIKH